MKQKNVMLVLGIIIAISIGLRVWGISYDLPYVYHPDEPVSITIAQNMFKTGDLNPHFFGYSSLVFYIQTMAYIPYYLFGKVMGVFQTRQDILSLVSLTMGVTRALMPTAILLQRLVSVCFGVGTVVLTFFIGKHISGKELVGFLAALMMAISPSIVTHSRLITPNIFVIFFALAAFLASMLIYQHGKTWHYVVAGLCVGFTISSKYNGGLIVLPLLLAHFLRYGKGSLKEGKLYVALFLCGVGFLATTPFALLDFPKFYEDFVFHAQYYSSVRHPGMEGNTLKWYLDYAWKTGGILYVFAILEILRGIYSRSKETALLAIFPMVYFGYVSTLNVRNDRTFLPVIPFLFVLAASLLAHLLDKTKGISSKALCTLSSVALTCLTAIALLLPASKTFADTIKLTTINSRETARVWIMDNLSPGTKIALESYTPFVEPAIFSVQGFGMIIDHKPEWYIENGFDYLVFGQGMYQRFYREPEKYSVEVAQYDSFFNRFTLLKAFTDGDYEVRVYAIQ